MVSKYIIKFSQSHRVSPVDCTLNISPLIGNIPMLTVTEEERKNILLSLDITNKISFNFLEQDHICNIKYTNFKNQNGESILYFGNNNTSAFKDFRENITKILTKKYKTMYYESGNIMYSGETAENKPNGVGALYYDSPTHEIKYHGEFEDSNFDGAGIFYSKSQDFRVEALNISNGYPTQKGKFKIFSSAEEIDIEFSKIYKDFDLVVKEEKNKWVSSDDFTTNICNYCYPNIDSKEHTFTNKVQSEQLLDIWRDLQEIKERQTDLANIKLQTNVFFDYEKLLKKSIICNIMQGFLIFVFIIF